MIVLNKLDNPVWFALSETHKAYSLQLGNMAFYHPDYCPFGACVQIENTAGSLENYAQLTPEFFIVGLKPQINHKLQLINEMVCLQMILEKPIPTEQVIDIKQMQLAETNNLYNLVNLVQPGYFKTNTALLGNYFGIYNSGNLIAVTGERMRMEGYTEVSAVVTHPHHLGKGYAKQLIAYTTNQIFKQNLIPFLHVAETNLAAIHLYEKLGFKTRRKISFWHFKKC